jgi:hypothetical protein
VALGKEQPDTFQKVEMCAELVFWGQIQNMLMQTFFAHILTCNTLKLPRIQSPIQMIRGLRVMLDVDLAALYGGANCEHLQNLTDPPERPIQGHDK